METKPVINIAGTVCPPETDEEFNKWYDDKHIPLNMKFKGLAGVTRYKIVRSNGDAIVKEYPRYFTTYRLKDLETFAVWNTSPELAAASEDVPWLFAKLGIEVLWRVQYESIKTWGETSALSVINVVGVQCPSDTEARFDTYYSEQHIPDALRFEGLEGVTRYRLASSSDLAIGGKMADIKVKDYPKHLTFYHFKDFPAFEAWNDSPERAAVREGWLSVTEETGASVLWRAQYEPMRTWQR